MAQRPNVLLITTDHWSAELLGAAGHPAIHTPTLDELARSGIRFSRAYSECPVCIPARRTLMTGTTPRTHGDRIYKERLAMPPVPTLARTFREAGYQAFAVGKMHVYPQRDRIGFDDVILDEEGRVQFGCVDDYDLFLGDRGHTGRQFAHGMGNNEYVWRSWHLAEELHPTNWATQQMARVIKRRDPTRPALWYLGYRHPHPPLAPLKEYLDFYAGVEIPAPESGEWALKAETLPYALRHWQTNYPKFYAKWNLEIRRAFYALCTHIDHQLRVVIGTLREEGLLDNTIIVFTADHGDMLGTHGLWGKCMFYEPAACIPMLLLGVAGDSRVGYHRIDDRICGLQDVMPTLLELAGIDIPKSVEGLSLVGARKRDCLYGEWGENALASRMVHDGRHKLIYYPVGNRLQLYDLREDPREHTDLAGAPEYALVRERLSRVLIEQLNGGDEAWAQDGRLVGLPEQEPKLHPNRGLFSQRGSHWPLPPGEA